MRLGIVGGTLACRVAGGPAGVAYPHVLAGALGVELVHGGRPGAGAAEVRRVYETEVRPQFPEIVVVHVGYDDVAGRRWRRSAHLPREAMARVAANVARVVDLGRADGALVAVVGPPAAPGLSRGLVAVGRVLADTVARVDDPSVVFVTAHDLAATPGALDPAAHATLAERILVHASPFVARVRSRP